MRFFSTFHRHKQCYNVVIVHGIQFPLFLRTFTSQSTAMAYVDLGNMSRTSELLDFFIPLF